MFKKETLPLIIGIGLPLLLIAYVAATVYLPSLFNKPLYDFVYATGYDSRYVTVENQTVKLNQKPSYYPNEASRSPEVDLYYYDVSRESSKLISLEEAQTHKLDPSEKSPDGYVVSNDRDRSYSFFPFFYGGSDRGTYLTGHGVNKRVSEKYYDLKFLGWVKK